MAHTDPFLLGPVGAMTPLPGVIAADGVGVTHERIGPGATTGLRSGLSLDVRAVKREYTLAWPLAARAIADRLTMRWRGTTMAPLRLLDPFAPNLLTADASVAGAIGRTPTWNIAASQTDAGLWGIALGGTASVGVSASDLAGTPTAGLVDQVARWDAPGGEVYCYPDYQNGRWVPVLGRPLTFSCYARGNVPVTPQVRFWTSASGGTPTVTFGSSPVMLSQTWQRLVVTVPAGRTEPVANAQLRCDAVGTVQLTALQLEHSASPTPWSPGGGCPTVTVAGFGDDYRALGYRAVELTLREV